VVGRLCDAGKQVSLLTQHIHPYRSCIVGRKRRSPMRNSHSHRCQAGIDRVSRGFERAGNGKRSCARFIAGHQSTCTSRYEAFAWAAGSAFSRCAMSAKNSVFPRNLGRCGNLFPGQHASSLADSHSPMHDMRFMPRLAPEPTSARRMFLPPSA